MARLTEENVRLAREIIGRYPKARSATIPLLHLAQEQDGYVTNEAMSHIGELVGASSEVQWCTAIQQRQTSQYECQLQLRANLDG